MATLRLRPVTGIRGDSWVSNPRRIRDARVRRRRCNGVGVPGRASGALTTGTCEHVVAGCHSAMGCLGQGGYVGNSAIGQTCQPTRSYARTLNPLARGFLILPDANFLVRQCCAPLRSSRTSRVPWALTVLQSSQRDSARNESHSGISTPMTWRCYYQSAKTVHRCLTRPTYSSCITSRTTSR